MMPTLRLDDVLVSLIMGISFENETTYFGELTFNALVKFQVANGITPTGNFGDETKK